MSVHTPAPWTNEDYEITAADGSVICSVNSVDDFPCIDEDNTEEGMQQLIAEFEANARLIEAAPELLEVLKEEDALIVEAQKLLAAWIVDSGISGHDVLNSLLGLLDGPQQRLTQAKARVAIGKAGAQ